MLRLFDDADVIGRGRSLLDRGAEQRDESARESHNLLSIRLIVTLWAGLSVLGANAEAHELYIVSESNPRRRGNLAAHKDDQLRIFQNIYVVILSFGLREVADGLLGWGKDVIRSQHWWQISSYLPLFVAMNILALGLRFFFGVEEISRHLISMRGQAKTPPNWPLTLIHYPILIVHAWLFYSICVTFKDTWSVLDFGLRQIGWLVSSLLLVNVVWLCRLWYVMRKSEFNTNRETFWIRNNLVFGAIIMLCCGHPFVWAALPVWRASIVLSCLLVNSLLDLVCQAEHYVPQS